MSINDEVVEAAARASHRRWEGKVSSWSKEDPVTRANYLEDARITLEAAAPHLMAAAWDDGATDGHLYGIKARNPYRAAGAVE